MLIKFETSSDRVKGLSFHPKRPWILASLHTGVIQLWDYRMKVLIEKFSGHAGPVRGICFHNHQPLFVSGGDDYNVKLWNYTQKRCICILKGHIDYVRTTTFHHKYPWIASASDDQTIRIWNWQSRVCVCILTGHTHYVMSAMFHPNEYLLISASLDQTIRIWDISELQKQVFSHSDNGDCDGINLFAQSGGMIKYILEGHQGGVNWATFHPKLPLIASGSDDHTVKLWRMNESKAWEVDTCRGHFNNISCVIFHPNQEVLITNSEDKTIRVWDLSTRICLHTMRKDYQKFWILTCHPSLNLLAAGHDSGMVIFKTERERPVFDGYKNFLYYIKENFLRRFNFKTRQNDLLMKLKLPKGSVVTSIFFNPFQCVVLVCLIGNGMKDNYYDLYSIPKEENICYPNYKRFTGITAVWISGNKLAVMDKSHNILIKNLKDSNVKKIQCPPCNYMFFAGTGMLLLRDSKSVMLFDVHAKRSVGQVKIDNCRRVVWSLKMLFVALLAKHTTILCDKKMNILFVIRENCNIKSGVWDDDGAFIYSTGFHIKYATITGDKGIICSIDATIYITKLQGDKIFFLDRKCVPQTINIKTTELQFKRALNQNKLHQIIDALKNCSVIGKSLIDNMQQKGFSDIALCFVRDNKTKFLLAIECGQIDVAFKTAQVLNNKDYWFRLADVALIYGNYTVAEACHRYTSNFAKLAFLYLITGNLEKLYKIMKVVEIRQEISAHFQVALYLCDLEEMVKIFKRSRRLHYLADLASRTYGLGEDKNENDCRFVNYLKPLPPVTCVEADWPLLNTHDNIFKNLDLTKPISIAIDEYQSGECVNDWKNKESSEINTTSGWDIEDNLDLDVSEIVKGVELPLKEVPKSVIFMKNSQLPVYNVMCGSFETAVQFLHQQIGIVNFVPYQRLFTDIFCSHRAVLSWQSNVPFTFCHANINENKSFVSGYLQLEHLLTDLHSCYDLTTAGKFVEAVRRFQNLLLKLTLSPQISKKQVADVKKIVTICGQYILGLKMEIFRQDLPKETSEQKIRHCELVAYFTHLNLQLVHQVLTLKTAVKICFQMKNYKTTILLASRLQDLNPQWSVSKQVEKILKVCDANPVDELELNYNEYNPFKVCGISFTPIYRGNAEETCPLCGVAYLVKYKGFLCSVCNVAEVGKTGSWLKY